MPKLRLTPQKREFFELYAQASANAVEIARLLVDLLETFPQDGDTLIARIKEREHDGDRLTHEVVLLLNSTFAGNHTDVVLSTSRQTPGTVYSVTVSNLTDDAPARS